MDTLPLELLRWTIRNCNVTTLIRLTMASQTLGSVAREVAKERCEELRNSLPYNSRKREALSLMAEKEMNEWGFDGWARTAEQPLPALFRFELKNLVREVPQWQDSVACFKADKTDYYSAMRQKCTGLFIDGDAIEWLHEFVRFERTDILDWNYCPRRGYGMRSSGGTGFFISPVSVNMWFGSHTLKYRCSLLFFDALEKLSAQ